MSRKSVVCTSYKTGDLLWDPSLENVKADSLGQMTDCDAKSVTQNVLVF